MDYETDQLDAHDIAETERYLIGFRPKPVVPERDDVLAGKETLPQGVTPADMAQQFMIDQGLAVSEETRAETGEQVLKRTIGGGVRDAIQGGVDTTAELIEVGAFGVPLALNQQQINMTIPKSRLPEVAEPTSFINQIVRDFVQFGTGMVMTPGGGLVFKSAVADAYFEPTEGGFIRPLIDLGILPEALAFLAVDVDEEAGAAERLLGRGKLAGQGMGLGIALDGLVTGLRTIKNSPELLRRAANTIATVTGATALIPSDAEGASGQTIKKLAKEAAVELSTAEREVIEKDVANQVVKKGKEPVLLEDVINEAERLKNAYPAEDGWLPINVQTGSDKPTFKVNKSGTVEIRWQQPSYAFHNPPGEQLKGADGKAQRATHQKNLVDRTVSDVTAIVERARNGDEAAIEIINQANWYRAMRTRLRKEFGGLGDVFADVLGATSAQTNVQQNYENALQVLRRFTRGEFDKEIALYQKLVASGEPRGQKLFARDDDPADEFRLIRKASGELFNTNSAAATEALLDMFRQIKHKKAPKTINFTGNLIGFGNEATIDVWAARFLRDAAGLPRIPPPAEKAVAGDHLTKSTMDNQRIGGEFGFGQTVFSDAAAQLNASGIVKEVNPEIGDMGADDLQAVVWFLEKEKWANNGWTTKAGEGGSLDYESVYGGSTDRGRVAQLRSIINKKGSTPEQIADAKAELATLEGEPQRFVAGVSMERPGMVPSNTQQAQLAEEVTKPLVADEKVIGFQANNTLGEFMGETERALNYEVVTNVDFDPTELTKALVAAGKKYNQDAVFVSKVVPDETPNARPGGEVYFRDRQGVDFVQKITAILKKYDIDGFTYVTDARQADRASVQAGSDAQTAGLTGIRFQYIPEFAGTAKDPNLQTIMDEAADTFSEAMEEIMGIDGITFADLVYYDTKVYSNPDVDYIVGATSYEAVGTTAGSNVSQVRQGQPNGSAVKSADSGG